MGGQGGGVKTKKRKAAPGADFSKVKHKVGRKLPPKKNETALDTRSKRINLPNQRVAEHETDGSPPSLARPAACAQTLCAKCACRRRRPRRRWGTLSAAAHGKWCIVEVMCISEFHRSASRYSPLPSHAPCCQTPTGVGWLAG